MKSFKSIDEYGTIRYNNENGDYHREDGPAYENINGHKEWRIKGKLHREDGPAYEKPDSYKVWYKNNKRHREDGPAIEYSNGDVEYWLNHIKYSVEDWGLEVAKLKLERIKDL